MIKRLKIFFLIWVVFETLHVITNDSNLRLNIFLLYELLKGEPYPGGGRYITNLFYDGSVHFYWLVSTFTFWRLFKYFKIAKHTDVLLTQLGNLSGYLKVIFFWRIIEFILYLFICNQSTNMVTLPILLILLLYENRKTV